MPYIEKGRRKIFDKFISLPDTQFIEKGDMTYMFYKLALDYIHQTGMSYDNISTIISCLDDAKEEIRRRILNPYEDNKIKENGDIN